MKHCKVEFDCVGNKFLRLPNVERYDIVHKTKEGFVAQIEMEDGYEFLVNVYAYSEVFPSTAIELIEKKDWKNNCNVIICPYISERTAKICEQNGIGYFDYAGNCYFSAHSIFIMEKGNKNQNPKLNKAVSVFETSSVVSSLILRKLLSDVSKEWKQKHLAEKLNCSIGQVSKVIHFLKNNAWIKQENNGYKITDIETLMNEWSRVYGKKEKQMYGYYSLEQLSVIEKKLVSLRKDMGIDTYLTGISGGVRYAPVVRYNKLYMYIAPEDIQEAIQYLELKEVTSGANVILCPLDQDTYIKDARLISDSMVVSPVQIYLDCKQMKGRGEEMAEAVLEKEILNGKG